MNQLWTAYLLTRRRSCFSARSLSVCERAETSQAASREYTLLKCSRRCLVHPYSYEDSDRGECCLADISEPSQDINSAKLHDIPANCVVVSLDTHQLGQSRSILVCALGYSYVHPVFLVVHPTVSRANSFVSQMRLLEIRLRFG
jgi:hypothetical protein